MLVLTMIFLHLIADFNIQGILGHLKQKDWWRSNYPETLYKYDWFICGFLHAFEWTFIIYIPIFIKYRFELNLIIIITFIINMILHFIVDHLKANKRKINLIVDQICHLLQIWITAGIFMYLI